MSKTKELLKELNKVFKLPELDAALQASNFEDAVNDDLLKKIKETSSAEWLTVDAAKNSQAIADHFKEHWRPVHTKSFLEKAEKDFDEMFGDLGDDVKSELSGKKKLNEKIAYAKELAKQAKAGGNTEDAEKAKKTIADLKKQLAAIDEEKLKEIEAIKKASGEEINGYKNGLIKERFKQVATSKEWADAYKIEDVRQPVLESAFSKLSEKALIDLDKTGNIVLRNKQNPELELFEGSKKVSFESLVDAQIAPFIKKSNGTTQQQTPTNGNPKTLTNTDLTGMNWQEKQILLKRNQAAGQTA